MKYILLFSALIASLPPAFGQKDTTIQNTITPSHQSVAGTKVSLIPPSGFVASTQFNGYQRDEDQASILVVEMPAPFSQIQQAFTADQLATKQIHVNKLQKLQLNNYQAVFIDAVQTISGLSFKKLILAFGDDTQTILVNGAYPDSDTDTLLSILKPAIFSAVYEPNKTIDAEAAAPFEIDVSGTDFKFTQMIAGTLLYTVDKKIPAVDPENPMIIVSPSLGEQLILNQETFAIKRFKQFKEAGSEIRHDPPKAVTINGLKGFEIYGYREAKEDPKNERIYQLMLFKDQLYYLFVGICGKDFEENLVTFKQVSQTFRLK